MNTTDQQSPLSEKAEGASGPSEPVFTLPEAGTLITSEVTRNTYRIGSLIGEGSFGYVYHCTDTWENELAVKILKPRGTYDEIRQKAIAEFEKLKFLRHPNITYVYDAFEFRHTFYIVCEKCWQPINDFVQSEDFNGRMWIRAIARQLLQAIHFIHCNDFAHQDIHGGNVFIQAAHDDLSPKEVIFTFMLGDLGLAKLATDMDAENTILADWMRAPESMNTNEFGTMDHRMDIYHCGLLFLQILLGKPHTFTKDEILSGKPRELALQLETPYSFALEKALRRHVDYRTASALEFWRDLNSQA
jgi:eukaryotic-like serine/threonine-protein kinase